MFFFQFICETLNIVDRFFIYFDLFLFTSYVKLKYLLLIILINIIMKKIFFIMFILSSFFTNAQDILGKWVSYDDETKKPKSEVEIYEQQGKYYGKVIKLYNILANQNPEDVICDKCKGDKKDKPVIGMNVIENLIKKGNEYKDGTITDPQNGKSYNCSVKIDPRDSNILIVKGSIGPFSRSQYWKRP